MKDFNKDNYAKEYINDISLKLPGYFLMFDLIFNGVLPSESIQPNNILNIGAGEIELNELITMYENSTIDVVDASPKMIEQLKSNIESNRIHYHCMMFDEFEIKTNYNLIISLLVIHFVEDKQSFLKKVYDALEDQGVFILSAFSNEQLEWWKNTAIANGANADEVNSTYEHQETKMKSVSADTIEEFAHNAGFKHIEKIAHILSIDLWILKKD